MKRVFSRKDEQKIVNYAKATGHGFKRIHRELGLACSPITVRRILIRDENKLRKRKRGPKCVRCKWGMQHASYDGMCGFCQEEIKHKIPANQGYQSPIC